MTTQNRGVVLESGAKPDTSMRADQPTKLDIATKLDTSKRPECGAKLDTPPKLVPTATLDTISRSRRSSIGAPSAIREILKVTEHPEIISFAGGLPAEELFPVEQMSLALAATLRREGRGALQYSTTEGFRNLREWIASRMSSHGRPVRAEELIVTHGSQQGIDLVTRVLLDPGDKVAVESPSYLAALQVFRAAEACMVPVPMDRLGVDLEGLDRVLAQERPKFLYMVPDHQNPAGTRLPLERRLPLLEICRRHGVAILEDDPYGEICFEGRRYPPLFSLDEHGVVVYLSTFSKTLAPGLRLGWMVASPDFLRAAVIAKQSVDLHTSTLTQRAVACLLETFDYDAHLARVREVYGGRARAMEAALREIFPREARWVSPTGGLFLWLAIDAPVSVQRLFMRALDAKVAFVPGDSFFVGEVPGPHLRLNFSHRPEPVIQDGIRKLGKVLAEEMRTSVVPAGRYRL